jgi:hypothetical protein
MYATLYTELAVQIQEEFDALMKSPKQPEKEVAEMRRKIEANQSLLIQWAEEKAQLALTGYELIDTQYEQVNADLAGLAAELQATGQMMEDGYGGIDDYSMDMAPPEPSGRRGASRLHYAPSFDPGLEQSLGLETGRGGLTTGRKSTTIPLNLSRQQSEYGSEGPYPSGSDYLTGGWDAPKSRLGGSGRRGGLTTDGMGQSGAGARRRAAASAAVQAIAAFDDDDFSARDQVPMTGEGEQFVLKPFVPGLAKAAKSPQAPGKLLTEADICPDLAGRVAEVFWPDETDPAESLWYLVKIESIDMGSLTASIRYQNGESEPQLDLVEVAREGHMMLLHAA